MCGNRRNSPNGGAVSLELFADGGRSSCIELDAPRKGVLYGGN